MIIEDLVRSFLLSHSRGESDIDGLVGEITRIVKDNLGLYEGELLGDGSYGTAIDIGEGRVLKLTTDPEEVATSAALVGRDLVHVARIDGAYWLDDIYVIHPLSNIEVRIGAVILEKLDRVGFENTDDQHILNIVVNDIKKEFQVWPNNLEAVSRETARQRLKRASEAIVGNLRAAVDDAASADVGEIADGVDELRALGIYIVDVHSRNIGFSEEDGVYKIFDVGVSSSPRRRKAPTLRNPEERSVPTMGAIPHWPSVPINRTDVEVPILT
jgi:hypothetical protein